MHYDPAMHRIRLPYPHRWSLDFLLLSQTALHGSDSATRQNTSIFEIELVFLFALRSNFKIRVQSEKEADHEMAIKGTLKLQ